MKLSTIKYIAIGGGLLWLASIVLGKKGYETLLDDKSMKKLDWLLTQVKPKVIEWAARCSAEGLVIRLGDTFRGEAAQNKAYMGGKSGSSGKGKHWTGRALDFVLKNPKTGKFDYSANSATMKPLYTKAGQIAESIGFKWLGYKVLTSGDGKPFQDPYHIEWNEGMTKKQQIARVLAGTDKRVNGLVEA